MDQSGIAKAPLSTGELGHVLFPSMVQDTAESVLILTVHATSMICRRTTGFKSSCNVVSWCRVKANKVVKLTDQQSQLTTIGTAPAARGQYVVVLWTSFDDHFSPAYTHLYTVRPSTFKTRIHPAYLPSGLSPILLLAPSQPSLPWHSYQHKRCGVYFPARKPSTKETTF